MNFRSCFVSAVLFLRVLLAEAEAEEWSSDVPASVWGLEGSCLLIPCSFTFPASGQTYSTFTGIWYKQYAQNNEMRVFHSDISEISEAFKDRTSLIGHLNDKNCSLNISRLSIDDIGPYMFRIEIKDLDKNTYKNVVSVKVTETPPQPKISMEDEVTSGTEVIATCAVSYSCPSDQPQITWSHEGTPSSPSQPQNQSEWRISSHDLTFTPTREDHLKNLSCTAEFHGKTVMGYRTLKVKYPPYDVKIAVEESVMENSSVKLGCSSNSNPPSNYTWFSSSGRKIGEGPTHQLVTVTRHTEAISCTATNTEGKNSSGPQKLNILYQPHIKSESSCQSLFMRVCVCIVDSNPYSDVQWLSSDTKKTFPSSNIERSGTITKATLDNWWDFPDTINCSANNTLGSSSISMKAAGKVMPLYIGAALGGLFLVGIILCAVKTRCVRRDMQHNVLRMENRQREMRKTANYFDSENSKAEKMVDKDIYANCPSDSVYANREFHSHPQPSEKTLEDETVYGNI